MEKSSKKRIAGSPAGTQGSTVPPRSGRITKEPLTPTKIQKNIDHEKRIIEKKFIIHEVLIYYVTENTKHESRMTIIFYHLASLIDNMTIKVTSLSIYLILSHPPSRTANRQCKDWFAKARSTSRQQPVLTPGHLSVTSAAAALVAGHIVAPLGCIP
jgi:hypothetical protein